MTVSKFCLIKLLPYILFEKYIYIFALEMANPGNQCCSTCIGALSFPRRGRGEGGKGIQVPSNRSAVVAATTVESVVALDRTLVAVDCRWLGDACHVMAAHRPHVPVGVRTAQLALLDTVQVPLRTRLTTIFAFLCAPHVPVAATAPAPSTTQAINSSHNCHSPPEYLRNRYRNTHPLNGP